MNKINGFAPIANQNSKILILGSMPGDVSLQKQQYYGHQRNAFWPIMMELLNEGMELYDYEQRTSLLINNEIALWDVLQSCHRSGSLDTAIKMDTIQVNDFYQFFSLHTAIQSVFFNGAKAENIYKKYVLPAVKDSFGYVQYNRLPSTSPAHAAMKFQDKKQIWQKQIKDTFV